MSYFLHLLKRLRYRLLSSRLHTGFEESNPSLDVDHLSEILDDMGDVVLCNDLFTKMHDALPLELFKVENFIKLLENVWNHINHKLIQVPCI